MWILGAAHIADFRVEDWGILLIFLCGDFLYFQGSLSASSGCGFAMGEDVWILWEASEGGQLGLSETSWASY